MDFTCRCGARHGRSALICPKCGRRLDPYSMDTRPSDVGTGTLGERTDASADPRPLFADPIEWPSRERESDPPAQATPRRERNPLDRYTMDLGPADLGDALPLVKPSEIDPAAARRVRERPAAPPAPRTGGGSGESRPQAVPIARPPSPAERSKTRPPAPVDAALAAQADSIRAGRTVQFVGVDIDGLRARQFVLQIFGKDGRWHGFKAFDAKGIKIGSGERTEKFPALRTMAARHLRLTPVKQNVMIEDLGSLNGVFRRITQPQTLTDGTRFRIGQYLIEFHRTAAGPEVVACTRDGEELYCVDPVAPAVLVFIRPDGTEGLRIPLTKTETVLGQERQDETGLIDIHLPADLTSARHARIVRRHQQFFLENLSQRNGTFVQIQGVEQIKLEDEILAGQVKFRVVLQTD